MNQLFGLANVGISNYMIWSNLVSFYNAQGSNAVKIALGICFRHIMILYWYCWSCIVYCVFYLDSLSKKQDVSSHFSLRGNGCRVVSNRNHRLSSLIALFNCIFEKTWKKSKKKQDLELQEFNLFQLYQEWYLFGLYRSFL